MWFTWWRHQWKHFPQTICAGNSLVIDEFHSQRPMTQSFDIFFDLRLTNGWVNNRDVGANRMPSRSLWHHCHEWLPKFSTPVSVLSLYATWFALCTGGQPVSFIEAYLHLFLYNLVYMEDSTCWYILIKSANVYSMYSCYWRCIALLT